MRAELFERRHERSGAGAVEAVAVVLGRDLRDDRQIADAAHGADRGADLVDVAEGFEHEQIDAPLESARACSRKNSSASSTPVLPHGSMRMPSGPIAPATYAWSRAAWRASFAPCRLMS